MSSGADGREKEQRAGYAHSTVAEQRGPQFSRSGSHPVVVTDLELWHEPQCPRGVDPINAPISR